MKSPTRPFLLSAWLIVAVCPLRGQVVADGETKTLSNVTNIITGDVTVGTNVSFTLLVLSDNALLTNSANGIIGRNAASKSNQVHLISPSGRWLMDGRLFVGSNGPNATLIVSNGALVRARASIIGHLSASGSNLVLVTGAGSTWSNFSSGVGLAVGPSSSGNQLIVSNGGLVINDNGSASIGNVGSNNVVRVTGAGSVWNNRFALHIGTSGSANVNNRLLVEEGGQVFTDDATVGGLNGSKNNFAMVTGSGSLWSNNNLRLTQQGGLALVVTNGGTVLSSSTFIGSGGIQANFNQAVVTGGGSLWSNRNDLVLGVVGTGNALVVSNGGWVVNSNAFIGGLTAAEVLASNNTVTVTGAGSVWSNRADLLLGVAGDGNQLLISDGAAVSVGGQSMIGKNSGADSNSVAVTDLGTRWMVTSNIYVGSNGSFNGLLINNAARVANAAGIIGSGASSRSNEVIVTGPGSTWTNNGGVVVGDMGSGNRLVVSNGAIVHMNNGVGFLGRLSGSSNNQAVVTGPGSLWNFPFNSLLVGPGGSGNRLLISNGGTVRSGNGSIGGSLTVNNEVTVIGVDAVWANRGNLVVGDNGAASRLTIINRGEVFSELQSVIVGANATSTRNRLIVDGGTLRATNATHTGTLDVRRGTNVFTAGLIEVDRLIITNTLGAFEFNEGKLVTRGALITTIPTFIVGTLGGDDPAVWDVRAGAGDHFLAGDILLGNKASHNQLLVTNGAVLTNSGHGVVGEFPNATSNLTMISGPGSKWTMTGGYLLGRAGAFNRLVVSNGATLSAQGALLGLQAQSSNNLAIVTGANSIFAGETGLVIGDAGSGNKWVVTDGGTTANNDGYIGFSSSSGGNEVLVSEPGSAWINMAMLHVGYGGTGNQLTVSNGGRVDSSSAVIGDQATSLNSMAVVSGAGSLWTNHQDLIIGANGDNSRLLVNNGGTMVTSNAFIGTAALNNSVQVDDAGSLWLIRDTLRVGSGDGGNQLRVNNGARVESGNAILGFSAGSDFNGVVISGAGSHWNNQNSVVVGQFGRRNVLGILNGAVVSANKGFLGLNSSSKTNSALVAGVGSLWSCTEEISIGDSGSHNQMTISDGGVLHSLSGVIGFGASSSNNVAVVTGADSSWTNEQVLVVGFAGPGNQLVVSNAGSVFAPVAMVLGGFPSSTGNRVTVDGGALRMIPADDGFFEVRRGTNVLNAGLMDLNHLVMTNLVGQFEFNGGTLITRGATISNGAHFVVGRAGSTPAVWDLRPGGGDHILADFALNVGRSTASNQLLVTNGATLITVECVIGSDAEADFNTAVVAGPGSRWFDAGDLFVGLSGSFNSLVISNGGQVVSGFADLGNESGGTNNHAIVAGAGSTWSNQMVLQVGRSGSGNRLLISDGATVFAGDTLNLGFDPMTSSNNLLHVAGGTLRVQNAGGTGTLNLRSGTNRLDAGLVEVDRLVMTNARGLFVFNGGTASVGNSTVNNGQAFRIGDGVSAATFTLVGNGLHSFGNGVSVSANAMLTGNGTMSGPVTVASGGKLVPGASVGRLVLSNSPVLQGAVIMEVSRTGGVVTNDQIQVIGSLTYGGALTVSNVGPAALAVGDRFRLFSAGAYAGSFSSLTLPPLTSGLNWTNKLLVDGSIEVTGQPKFLSIELSGTNVIISGNNGPPNSSFTVLTATNIAEPLSNWVNIATHQFGSAGEFSFTNGVMLVEPQRFFRLRIP